MQFTPKTKDQFEQEEKERREKYLWPADTRCKFEVLYGVKEKDGNYGPYFQADIRVFKDANTWLDLREFLAHDSGKFFSFCEATGLSDRYQAGQVDTFDIEGKSGECVLGIKKGKDAPDGGKYPDKNNIKEYIKPAAPILKGDPELNDSIDF